MAGAGAAQILTSAGGNCDLEFLRDPSYLENACIGKMLYTGPAVASLEAVSIGLSEHGL